ncbi:hypothetical protein AMECASPLE_039079 [Ameca splendens]|uniref:Uncharacterized protein n=1 Tax=Ameca splendens TaxID=208324 RepID=A0ABV0XX79_9TELE
MPLTSGSKYSVFFWIGLLDSSFKFPVRTTFWLTASRLNDEPAQVISKPCSPPIVLSGKLLHQCSSPSPSPSWMLKKPSFLENSSCLKDQFSWINLSDQGHSCAELPDSTFPFPLAVHFLIPV